MRDVAGEQRRARVLEEVRRPHGHTGSVREDDVCRQQLSQCRSVCIHVCVPLLSREVLEEARVQALVLVQHEDGQQRVGQLGNDDACTAEVVALGITLLADDDHVVAGVAPLAREGTRVHVRPGAAEEVAVPEEDPHGCRGYVRWK